MTPRESRSARGAAKGRAARVAVRLLLSAGLIALLLVLVPWDQVTAAAAQMTLALYAMAMAGYLVGHSVGAAKWRLMLGASRTGGRLSVRDTAGCYSAGLFANLFLPTVVGGDLVRATLAARALGRPEAVVLGSIADRVIDFAGLGLLIAAGAVFAGAELTGWAGPLAAIVAIVGLGAGLLLLPLAFRRPMRKWPRRFRRRIGRALVALRHLGRRPRTAVLALFLSLSMQSLFIVVTAQLGQAVGAVAPLWVWFVVWPLAKVIAMAPVSLGGFGVRDAALTTLLASFGVPAAYGLVTSLAWNAVLLGGTLIAGGVALVLRPRRRPQGEQGAHRLPGETDPARSAM
jgi:glycosyltransferase 2 family protein